MKHIVFVVGNYKNGGVPMHSTNLANAFAEKGYFCTILVTKEISNNIFFELHKNVEVVLLKDYVNEHKKDDFVQRSLNNRKKRIQQFKRLRYVTRLNKKIDKMVEQKIKELRRGTDISVYIANNPDSILISFGISYYEQVFYVAKEFGCKLIYAERTFPEIDFPKEENERKRLLRLVSLADGIVFQTQVQADFFDGYYKECKIIHNPIKTALPLPYSGKRRKTVVNFCRLSKEKNLVLLIEAFEKLHIDYPDYELEIYGNVVTTVEEALKKELELLIAKIGAQSYIHIMPPRADVHNAIKDVMMFVSSSDFEGLSNSMLEAMAIGLPCVCTDCLGGGAREMIKDGETGLLVPIGDKEMLYVAMKRMIEDEALRLKCSLNAERIRKKFSVNTISEQWLDFLTKC